MRGNAAGRFKCKLVMPEPTAHQVVNFIQKRGFELQLKFEGRNLGMSRNSTIIFLLNIISNHRNALNTNFVMTILSILENQRSKFQFLKKTTFYISVGQICKQCFQKEKQQIVLSLDFSVRIICSNTKNSHNFRLSL